MSVLCCCACAGGNGRIGGFGGAGGKGRWWLCRWHVAFPSYFPRLVLVVGLFCNQIAVRGGSM